MKKTKTTLPLMAAIVAILAVWFATPANALANHQCVDAEILMNGPITVRPGEVFDVRGQVSNCGNETNEVVYGWAVSNDHGRVVLFRDSVVLRPDQTAPIANSFQVPRDAAPGTYTLLLGARTPTHFTDIDRIRLIVER